MYQLFSHTNTTGSRHTAARLTASWNAPMLVAPSPKKQTVTCPVRRIMAAQASPQAIGRGGPPHRGQVDRLVERPDVGGPVAEETDRDLPGAADHGRPGQPAGDRQVRAD